MMKEFLHRFSVKAPIEEVAAFHNDTQTLKKLTPPPVFVSLNDIQPLEENSVSDFTMWLGPIPLRWVAIHSNVHPTHGFTDTQVVGPFTSWVHQHRFESVGADLTEVVDHIQAQPGNNPFWGLISRFMWLNLPLMFAYRAWRTKKEIET